MKKLLLLLTLLCTVFSTVLATEVTIGDLDNASANSYLPANSLYNYSYTQQIYTAEEIGVTGTINSITLWLYGNANLYDMPFDIYMVEVDKESFADESDWAAVTSANLVCSKTITVNNTDAEAFLFELDTPFEYSGAGNLLIAVNNTTGSWVSGLNGMVFGSEDDPLMAIYARQDGSAYDPSNPGAATATTYARNVIMLDITGGSGPILVCQKPTSLVPSDTTAHGITLTWAGGSGVYNLEYRAAGEADWIPVLSNSTLTTTTLSNLTPNTSYQAHVQSYCANLDTVSSWLSTSFKTAIGLPYMETFTNTPANWTMSSSKLEDVLNGSSLNTVTYGWSFGSNNGVFDKHAYSNIYGTSCYKWLIAPALPMEDGAQLTFDLALTTYSGSTPTAVDPTKQNTHKFVVLASIDNGATWTILRQWDNDGSADVYNNIATNGEEITINLSDYAGENVKIAFYGEANASSSGDNNLHIDNVKIALPPTCLKPTDLIVNAVSKSSANIGWTANTAETAWKLQYKKSSASSWSTYPSIVSENPFTLDGLDALTAYDVRVAAVCDPEDPSAISDYSSPIDFRTAAGVPFEQSFNVSSLPADWQRKTGLLDDFWAGSIELKDTTGGWFITSTKNGVFPDANYHLKLEIGGTKCKHWIVSPSIEMAANQQLTFDMALTKTSGDLTPVDEDEQEDDRFYVLISTNNGESWDALYFRDNGTSDVAYDNISCSASGEYVVIDLSEYASGSALFAFYGESTDPEELGDNYLHIANFRIADIPDCEKPADLAVSGISGHVATFAWDEIDGANWEFGCVANPANSFAPTDADFVGNGQISTITLDTLAENTPYAFFLRRDCGESKSEVRIVRFSTIQEPASAPFVDDFEDGNKWLLINGSATNKWVVGEATNNGGTHALYISKDNGATNAYNTNSTTTVYATKTFSFDEAATYTFKYDWKAYGEDYQGPADYMRVALVPASVELAASATTDADYSELPTGWIALDGGALYQSSDWQTKSIDIEVPAGMFKVAVIWINDYSSGTQPSGAIDNFSVKLMTCATPSNLVAIADSITTNSVVVAWQAGGNESNWLLSYKKNTDAEWTAVAETLTKDTFKLEGLDAASIYQIKVAAWCNPEDEATIGEYTDAITVITGCEVVTSFPYSENFDALPGTTDGNQVLPVCWSAINTTTSAYAYYPTNYAVYPYSEPNSFAFYSNGSSSYDPQDQYAILPEMENISGLRIKLMARQYQSYDATFTVGVISDPEDAATFVPIATQTASSEYEQFVIPFNSYEGEGKHIAIKMAAAASSTYRAVFIDDVIVDEIPSCWEPDSLKAVLTYGNGTIATLQWAAGAANAWTVQYSKNANFTDSVELDVNEPLANLSGLTPEALYYARVKAICAAEEESAWSDAITFVPTNALIINDSTATNVYVPVYGTWVDDYTRSQFIIPEADLASIQWDSICKITFFTSASEVDWGNAKFEVYFAETSDTIISALTSWDAMIKVMSAAKLSVEDNQMVVTLDAPYSYEGGNLLIGFKQTVSGTYVTANWYGKNVTGASFGGYGTSVSQRNFLPKMKIDHIPGVAPSCLKLSNIAISEVVATSAKISWNAVEEQDAWQIVIDTIADFNPDTVSEPIAATAKQYIFQGLNPETTYYVYLRANCGEGDFSVWTARQTFTTPSACETPTELVASQVTDSSAVITWKTFGQEGFNLRYSTDGSNWTIVNDVDTPYVLNQLAQLTTYRVQVQPACNTEVWSSAVNFTTLQTAAALPFDDDFEGENAWVLVNGTLTNKWVIGEATANSGTHALYISNDNGVSNKYSNNAATVYAKKLFALDSAVYTFQYDWRANGESGYDFLRVALVPASVNLSASSSVPTNFATALPEGWIALDGGAQLSLDSLWKTKSVELAVKEGVYNLVFAWRNDNSTNNNPAAAVDNIHVSVVNCVRPTELKEIAADATTSSVKFGWTSSADAWSIQYKKSGDAEWMTIPENVLENPYELTGLDAATEYYVRVASVCGVNEMSAYSDSLEVVTACEVMTTLPLENFDSIAPISLQNVLPICWKHINTCSYKSSYSNYGMYPSVYNSSTSAHSGANLLRFYSAYSTYSDYDPQDQYAILPALANVSGLRLRLQARAASTYYDASFIVGVMSNFADTATFVAIDTIAPESTDYEEYIIPFNTYEGAGQYIAIKVLAANASKSTRDLYIDDVLVEEIPSCLEPSGLAIAALADTVATIVWDGEDGDEWDIAILANAALDSVPESFVTIDTNKIAIDTLAANTAYVFYLRRNCGNDDVSAIIPLAFHTTVHPAELPFADDFESDVEWQLINGSSTNAWVIGEATNNGGTHALYISNDGGTTNAYTKSSSATVFATKLFNFEEDGKYIFSYDWRAAGELLGTTAYDFLRVVLAPASAELTAGVTPSGFTYNTLPEGWIALDGGALHSSSAWQTHTTGKINLAAGLYYVVFVWKNDGSSGDDPAAAIDNVHVVPFACELPTELNASDITENSAVLDWASDASAWELVYSTDENFVPSEATPIAVTSKPYILGALNAETTYYYSVRANCGDGDFSAWSAFSHFTTSTPCVTKYAEEVYDSLCIGGSYTWQGKEFTLPGTYYDTLQTAAHCDSILTLVLDYYAAEDTIYDATQIAADELPFKYENEEHPYIGQDSIYYPAGTPLGIYYDTVLVVGEHCTAVLVHELTIERCEVEGETTEVELCPGEGYEWKGAIIGEAGTYYDTIPSAAGCDSIETLVLSFYEPEDTIFIDLTILKDSLPFIYENEAHPYITGEAPLSYPEGTSIGLHHDTAYVEGEHCTAVLVLNLKIEESQDIDNIFGRDGKGAQKVIYRDIMYIIINDEWYSAAGQKVDDPRK